MLTSIASLTSMLSMSITRINKRRDFGSPWRSPLKLEKNQVASPWMSNENRTIEIQNQGYHNRIDLTGSPAHWTMGRWQTIKPPYSRAGKKPVKFHLGGFSNQTGVINHYNQYFYLWWEYSNKKCSPNGLCHITPTHQHPPPQHSNPSCVGQREFPA